MDKCDKNMNRAPQASNPNMILPYVTSPMGTPATALANGRVSSAKPCSKAVKLNAKKALKSWE